MTHEQAIAEAARRQLSDPEVTWIATRRGSEWTVALGTKQADRHRNETAASRAPE